MGFFVVLIMAATGGVISDGWMGAALIGMMINTAYFIGRSGA